MEMKASKFSMVVSYIVVVMFTLYGIAKAAEALTPSCILAWFHGLHLQFLWLCSLNKTKKCILQPKERA